MSDSKKSSPSRRGQGINTAPPAATADGEPIIQQFTDPITGEPLITLRQLPGGLLAVDLECPEAFTLVPSMFPAGACVRDRPGKLRSRWVYRTK